LRAPGDPRILGQTRSHNTSAMKIHRREFLLQTAAFTATATLPGSAADAVSPLIIDTHQHLWDLSRLDLPWLDGVPEILKRSHGPEDYREATRGLNVKAIYMEVDVAQRQLMDEAEFVTGLARGGQTQTIAAVIGGRPHLAAFAGYIRRYRGNPLVKGVRRVLHIPETPAGFCLADEFVRGIRLLGEAGKSFDLCMRPRDLRDGINPSRARRRSADRSRRARRA